MPPRARTTTATLKRRKTIAEIIGENTYLFIAGILTESYGETTDRWIKNAPTR